MPDAPLNHALYRFDAADAQLTLLPMAARRALDCAGLHLSLKGWQALPLAQREALVRWGAAELVDVAQVAALLAPYTPEVRPTPPPSEAELSAELLAALPAGHSLSPERWCALRALDRYVLAQLARRGKIERLAEAYAEICGEPAQPV